MSDDSSSTPRQIPRRRNWFHRLLDALQPGLQNRDELLDSLREAADTNVVDRDTLTMLEGVLSVAELRVRDIMIPRSQMVVLDADADLAELLPKVVESGHSRYPVIGASRDQVDGILLAKDLLQFSLLSPEQAREQFDIHEILRPALVVPESKRLDSLLREFRSSRNHMAMVVDEYGGMSGLITIEDVLEQIVGEIADEYDFDDAEEYLRQLGDNEWHVRADMELEDFNQQFSTELDEEEFDTIGGAVANQFGHLPQRGEQLVMAGYELTVLASDSRRIKLLKIKKKPPAALPS
ncbi:CBS domain-containing protein [Permianibacter sp. IMCC34836]|uniref:HlyC/CorC family transporter n=1 Tax=Permianibacter fluminis TaxID=2738515 RepID=UPI001557A763|nr:transporter associated domain-containing protein [Permianibacter fluminis]NQD36852.1 CBS domain-containing protein [Permianibacter fluminis]